MRRRDDELTDELLRSRLDYLSAGTSPLVSGPRHGVREEPGWLVDEGLLDELAEDPPTTSERDRMPLSSAAAQLGTRTIAFGRAHLAAVLVVLLCLGLLAAGFMTRARATSIAVEAIPASPAAGGGPVSGGAAPATPSPGPTSSASAAATVRVHVLGAVRRPGVVELPAGARVVDALDRAGGLRGDASVGELNLAAPLADGDQLLIGVKGRPRGEVRPAGGATGPTPGPPGARADGGGGGATAGAPQVDLNQATVEQLDQLPGVGPVTAQRILQWREQHGRFSRVEELQEVDGIGPKTYSNLAPHVRV